MLHSDPATLQKDHFQWKSKAVGENKHLQRRIEKLSMVTPGTLVVKHFHTDIYTSLPIRARGWQKNHSHQESVKLKVHWVNHVLKIIISSFFAAKPLDEKKEVEKYICFKGLSKSFAVEKDMRAICFVICRQLIWQKK